MPIVDEMLLQAMQRLIFVELILLNAGLLSKTVCVVTGKHYVLAFKQFYKKIAGWIWLLYVYRYNQLPGQSSTIQVYIR